MPLTLTLEISRFKRIHEIQHPTFRVEHFEHGPAVSMVISLYNVIFLISHRKISICLVQFQNFETYVVESHGNRGLEKRWENLVWYLELAVELVTLQQR